MRILLSEGSGLTSRQVATRLHELGHEVEVLSSSALCLSRFTRHVRAVHSVPAFGSRPLAWLDAAIDIARARHIDLLFPTQEQVTVLSACRERVPVATLVPDFGALRRVQDKLSAHRTLAQLGLPQPESYFIESAADLAAITHFPVFIKRALSTASAGVRRATSASELRQAFAELCAGERELLVQRALEGPLVMIQALADGGRLVAVHANLRLREGASGGASSKESVADARIEADMARLVSALAWHGPLSLDAILSDDGPKYIDVNPRLVEPRNALLSGIDLVALAVEIACGKHPRRQPLGTAGVRSHQLLLAELRAAQTGRRALLRELVQAASHRGPYAHSTEELTPVAGDLRALLPGAVVALVGLAAPSAWRSFTGASVDAYAITPRGWNQILTRVDSEAREALEILARTS